MSSLSRSLARARARRSRAQVDAAEYVDKLRARAGELRARLGALAVRKRESSETLSRSISSYLSQLPDEQRNLLSAGIDDKTVDAMRMVVEYVLGMGGEPVEGDQTVTMQRRALEQLCVWQLVVGYRLREAEAKGDARQRLGN